MLHCFLAFAAALSQSEAPADVLGSIAPSIEEADRTQVLVLGTPHLSQIAGFEREMLAPLIAALRAWEPDAICVEAMPGRTIATMQADERFAPVLATFAGSAGEHAAWAQERLGVARVQAEAELRSVDPNASRLVRALQALAAIEVPTATLHWAEWRALGESLPEYVPSALAAFLDAEMNALGEIASLAVPLARALGRSRLYAIDDHLDKDAFLRIAEALTSELRGTEAERAGAAAVYARSAADLAAALERRDLLPHYLHLNDAAYGRDDVRAQWDLFLRTRLESGLDRERLALWDVRNLNIASNVRRVSAEFPGGRVLVIIGVGHKPFLDALLGTMLDVRTVSLSGIAAPERAGDRR